jgi:hypothetical protein
VGWGGILDRRFGRPEGVACWVFIFFFLDSHDTNLLGCLLVDFGSCCCLTCCAFCPIGASLFDGGRRVVFVSAACCRVNN